MKLLIIGAFLTACASLGGAQAAHPKPAQNAAQAALVEPKQEVLPQTTLEFKPVGDGLPVPATYVSFGHPVCGADGTYYLNAEMLPKGERQIIAISPTEKKVGSYNMASVVGLVNVQPTAMDATGSDLYVLAAAAKSDDLLDHDVKPGSAEAWHYRKLFILHFHDETYAPELIPLDLSFQPMQFAVMSRDEFVFLGIERANQTPVLAVVDGSGALERYIDAYEDFGTNESIVANAPRALRSQFKTMPEGARLGFSLVAAQFVHYQDSVLLLMPGSKAKIFTIRSGGALESRSLHLPAGLEAESIIPSDDAWLIRAKDAAAKDEELIVVVNPADGKALRIIHSPKMNADDITCVHDGNYYGVRWPSDEKPGHKAFLMKAAE